MLQIDEMLKIIFKLTCAFGIFEALGPNIMSAQYSWDKQILNHLTLENPAKKRPMRKKLSRFWSERSSNCRNDVYLSSLPSYLTSAKTIWKQSLLWLRLGLRVVTCGGDERWKCSLPSRSVYPTIQRKRRETKCRVSKASHSAVAHDGSIQIRRLRQQQKVKAFTSLKV